MFCGKCGVALKPHAKFCHKCGAAAPAKNWSGAVEATKGAAKRAEESRAAVKAEAERVDRIAAEMAAETATRAAAKPAETAAPEPVPELISTMPKAKAQSSNGQFNEWFSDAGDL